MTTITSSDWPAAVRIASIAQALSISPGHTSGRGYATLWHGLNHKLCTRMTEGSGDAREVSGVLQAVVSWIEGLATTRPECKQWFSGKEWTGLLETWISLGRRVCSVLVARNVSSLMFQLGDSSIIDEALSRMTHSARISSPGPVTGDEAGPSTPRSSTPPVQFARPAPARSGSSRRAVMRVTDAESAVSLHCGQLASIIVQLNNLAGQMSPLFLAPGLHS
jgi:hypothetical protein